MKELHRVRNKVAVRRLVPTGCAVALAMMLAGCGSTAQMTSTAPVAQDGLGPGPASALPTGSTNTPALGGASTGVVGSPGGTGRGGQPAGGAQGGGAQGGGSRGGVLPHGTAPDTSPLSLGILDVGSPNGAAAALGVNFSTSTTAADVTKALIRYFNKHGGMAGRKIVPVEYTIQPTSNNYVTELQAACASFTQDHKVAASISILSNAYYGTYEECLTKAGVPDFVALTGTADEHDLATYPGLVTTSSPSTNRRFSEMITRFAATGYLTSMNKLGIIVEDCPYNQRAYDRTITPLLKRIGVTPTRHDISCINGFGDAASSAAAFQSAVLPFRAAGVDRVMIMSNYEGAGLLFFENYAKSQGYAPSYLLTSTTGGAALAGSFNTDQMKRMRGVGWTPVLDINERTLASPTTRRCRAMLASEGIRPASKADDQVDIICDQFFLLEAVLQLTAGHSSRPQLLAGLASVRSGFVSPWSLRGATDFSVRRDGPALFAIWGYSTKCGCMDYLSAPSP